MGMIARFLFLALALLVPSFVGAEAVVPAGAPNFDGARVRPEGDAVRAGSGTDDRSAAQIARDEQAKADARVTVAASLPGPDEEIKPPKPNEWLKSDHVFSGVAGAFLGLIVGSLWGLTGLGIGALVGGLIGYGVSRFASKDA